MTRRKKRGGGGGAYTHTHTYTHRSFTPNDGNKTQPGCAETPMRPKEAAETREKEERCERGTDERERETMTRGEGDIRIHGRGVTLTHRYHETVGHYFPPMMGHDSRNILYVRTVPRFGGVWRRAHARRRLVSRSKGWGKPARTNTRAPDTCTRHFRDRERRVRVHHGG